MKWRKYMRAIVFCTTCRFPDGKKVDAQGVTGGERLAREMESLLAETGRDDIFIERQECLWSCSENCNVLLRDTEKFSYLTGRFAPERDSAQSLLAWFDLHGQSTEGAVPFRQWPDGMRGHFIARLPPEAR